MRNLRLFFFFFNDTATTEIYTLSLHDALPISRAAAGSIPSMSRVISLVRGTARPAPNAGAIRASGHQPVRSEEHTSELQSRPHLVCRLLLEKKKMYIAREKNTTLRSATVMVKT